MFKASTADTPEDPEIPSRPGWEGMHVWWLVDRDHGESKTGVFIISEFPPSRSHELHRHPNAEEFFYLLEGSGLHMTEEGPVQMSKGEVVFIPRNEWHGFQNDSGEPVRALTVITGVAKYEDAGYDVRPEPAGSV